MSIKPIKQIQLPEATINRFIQMIGEGYWLPGERLPSQKELATDLGIGVSSLREALQSLQAMGILEIKQGDGTFVTEEPYQAVQRLLALSLSLVDLDIPALFDARFVLESGLAYFAAIRATNEQINLLFENLSEQRQAIEENRLDDADEADIAFHRLIAEIAGSEFLRQVDVPLYNALERSLRNVPHTFEGWEGHRAVAEAIRERNPGKSAQLMRDLVEEAARIHQVDIKTNGIQYSGKIPEKFEKSNSFT
jgi:GntR family transcriptional regulator, transcriptional repressor for pyruvate dehydrogenase complex